LSPASSQLTSSALPIPINTTSSIVHDPSLPSSPSTSPWTVTSFPFFKIPEVFYLQPFFGHFARFPPIPSLVSIWKVIIKFRRHYNIKTDNTCESLSLSPRPSLKVKLTYPRLGHAVPEAYQAASPSAGTRLCSTTQHTNWISLCDDSADVGTCRRRRYDILYFDTQSTWSLERLNARNESFEDSLEQSSSSINDFDKIAFNCSVSTRIYTQG
jgi:hypothetical protein